MLLKKIHLCGFKSFADRITISFDKGITGIVGPNGSGKSNVIDAVRWVMGEQNAKNLRGQTATDIIFAGSAKRKSLSMAEVTLVFDNSSHSAFCPPEYRHETEISLTRRLYADGTREYLINKKPCRLKDIVGFFATTGLGGRSYSMIQQGQVERVLNAKPEEIREILEEAAGTLAFKHRRQEAQKKLDATRENLSRLQDIVSELERQRVALEGQVEKARQWRDLSQELRQKELELFAHNYAFFRVHFDELERQFASETELNRQIAAEMAKLEAEQKDLQGQLDQADPDLEGLHEQVSIVREDIIRAENTILNAESLLETGDSSLEAKRQEIEADRENLSKIEAQFEQIGREWQEAREKAKEIQEQIENFQAEVEAVDESARVYESKIEDYEDQVKSIDRLLDSNTVRCEAISRDLQRIQKDRSQLSERITVLQNDLYKSEQTVLDWKQKAFERQSGLDAELTRRSELEQSTRARSNEIAHAISNRDRLKEAYFDCRAKVQSLKEIIASSSDISSSIEALEKLDPASNHLHMGSLTNHLSLQKDAEDLSRGTVSAFEKWCERLLVPTISEFNALVKLAHRCDLSTTPVTILSASNAGAEGRECREWAEKFGAEPMSQYLTVAEGAPDLSPVLERLYYLPTLELADDEIRQMPKSIVIFTAQGVTTSAQFELTISSKNSAGILSRKSELTARQEELSRLEADLASVQGQVDTLESTQRRESAELRELEDKLRGENQEVMQLMAELQTSQAQLQHKSELLNTAQKQLEDLQQSETRSASELAELGENRISLGQERETVLKELEQVRLDSGSIEEQREEVFRLNQARKVDLAKSEVRAQTLEQSFRQTKEQVERLQSGLNRRYQEISRLEEELEAARVNSSQAREEMETLLARREELEEALSLKREENAGILENLRRTDDQLKVAREKYHACDKRLSSISVELERAKIGLSSAVQQAAEKYHEDISQYKIELDPNFSPDKTSRQVSKLRNQIESLGAINMMAIEEYDQLKEREQFIFSQREEVTSSIDLLQEAIEEMDSTSKNRFLESFHSINIEFGNLFPILFPGGEAKLELTNPEDPLNTGVDILVRLPGKKQQNMSLFSGGEKALTAISLIFALLKSKPTPFCFLDEVDAPLDEANVGRYNKVLEALSSRFQFIVITHNRRTMEVLDTLYGVTMQEPGVSKIVGVDLNKDLPDHLKKAFKENKAKPAEEGAPQRAVQGATAQSGL
jgi:chromosome segregation protein